MKKGLLFVFSLIFWEGNAQVLPAFHDTTAVNHEINFSGFADYGATAIQNQLIDKFIFGGVITSQIKDESLKKHKNINRIGVSAMGEIEYINYKVQPVKKKNWGILVKAGTGLFGGALYSKDFYQLGMYGNASFSHPKIDLTGTGIEMVAFQKVGFGMIDKKSKSSVSINLFNISRYMKLTSRDASITTSDNGNELLLTADGSFVSRSNHKFNQGVGLGVDVDFRLPIQSKKGNVAFVQIKAVNLGVGFVHQKQKVYTVDSKFQYQGFQFDQLVGDNGAFSETATTNMLDTIGVKMEEKSKVIILPGYLQVGKIVDENSTKKIQAFFGLRVHPTAIYLPYLYGGAHFKTAKWLDVGVNLGYGGFSELRGGLYTTLKFNKVKFALGTEDLLGLAWKKGRGRSLYFSLKCAF